MHRKHSNCSNLKQYTETLQCLNQLVKLLDPQHNIYLYIVIINRTFRTKSRTFHCLPSNIGMTIKPSSFIMAGFINAVNIAQLRMLDKYRCTKTFWQYMYFFVHHRLIKFELFYFIIL